MANNMTLLTCSVGARLQFKATKDLGNIPSLGNPVLVGDINGVFSFSQGRGNDEANLVWYAANTLSPDERYEIDLVGTLSTPFGDILNFSKVKAIVFGNTGTQEIRFAAKDWSSWCKDKGDYITVKGGGSMVITVPDASGFDVDDGNSIIELVNPSGINQASFVIGIMGAEIDSSSSSSSDSSLSTASSDSSRNSSSSSSSSSSSTDSSSSDSSYSSSSDNSSSYSSISSSSSSSGV